MSGMAIVLKAINNPILSIINIYFSSLPFHAKVLNFKANNGNSTTNKIAITTADIASRIGSRMMPPTIS